MMDRRLPSLVVLLFALFAEFPSHATIAWDTSDTSLQPLGQLASSGALDGDITDPEDDPDPDLIKQRSSRHGGRPVSDLDDGRRAGSFRVASVLFALAPKQGPPPVTSR